MKTKPDQEVSLLEENRRSLSTLARSIILADGDFSLILVRCNYALLQEKMWQKLRQLAPQPLDHLILNNSQTNLYQSIQEFATHREIYCLHIFGMETLENLEQMLVSSNQMRDEFNQTFNFPIVLWMTDEVLQKMTRLAADLKSWAASAIKFNLETEQLVILWQRATDHLFNKILATQVEIPLSNHGLGLAPGDRYRQELESALVDLQERGFNLSPALAATWQLILGRDAEAANQFPEAIAYYEQSLEFWRQSPQIDDFPNNDLLAPYICLYLERQGVLLLHLGLCYIKQAQLNIVHNQDSWHQAQSSFEAGVVVFQAAGQHSLAAQLLIYQGEVLQSLQSWQELGDLAGEALQTEAIADSPVYLARVYGFLATIACFKADWLQVMNLAQAALGTLERSNLVHSHTSFYLFLLAKSQRVAGKNLVALATLEQAKKIAEKIPHHSWHWLENYLDILEELRSLYGEMNQYLAAFEIKQQQFLAEQQYGIRTFIGASPLPLRLSNQDTNSGAIPFLAAARELDVKAIINRLVRADHKLTIIHGASGVGKTSLINGGLVPALYQRIIGTRITLPMVQRNYRDWRSSLFSQIQEMISQERQNSLATNLENNLAPQIEIHQDFTRPVDFKNNSYQSNQKDFNPDSFLQGSPDLAELINLVKKSIQANFLVVLVFDQFEDFFATCTSLEEKWDFYEFLEACLAIPFVKIILSIREDALHKLLDCDRYINLEVINHNILDRDIRYQLGNLSPEQAKDLIHNLTNLSRWRLEPSLIEAFVEDLVADSGLVRLIEMQVLGATLQAEKITTLAAYQNLGYHPRLALIELNLDRIIADCGAENQSTAWQILFNLTDDSHSIRPIKTFSELLILGGQQASPAPLGSTSIAQEFLDRLADGYPNYQALWTSTSGLKIELILKILVGSGLVLKVTEMTTEGYQLTYDYLSKPIRQRYLIDRQSHITTKLFHQAEELRIIRQQKVRAIAVSLAMGTLAITAVVLAWTAEHQRRLAENLSVNAQLSTLSASSEALFASGKQFDALLEAVRGATQLQTHQHPQNNFLDIWGKKLLRKINSVLPVNPGMMTPKNSVILPSNAILRSNAIAEPTKLQMLITLQQSLTQIKERNRLEGHLDIISHIAFSPDGKFIASASRDKTIKIWSLDGTNIATISGHDDSITSLSFSADGKFLASASWDGTAKIWSITPSSSVPPEPQVTSPTTTAPDSAKVKQSLAWELVTTIQPEAGKVYGLNFSPDGTKLVLATQNQSLQLWSFEGKLLKAWQGHKGEVTGVSFSPDGQAIASCGEDGLVKVWSAMGELQQTLVGHQGKVNSVNFSPDGTLIATTGDDRTIKLWDRQGQLTQTLTGHQGWVMYASFSANSEFLVSAGRDDQLRIWRRDGTLVESFKAHSDRINAAVFSPSGTTIVSGSEDKTLKLWAFPVADRPLRAHGQQVNDVKFSPNGQFVASGSHDHTIKLWQIMGAGSQQPRAKLTLNPKPQVLAGSSDRVTSLAFAGDGSLLASASRDGTVRLWNLEEKGVSNQNPVVIQQSDWVNQVTFSPDSQVIATANRDRTVKLWDRQGRLLQTLEGHSDRVNTVIFSPDGLLIASASDDQTVKLWTKDGQLLKTLRGHQGWVLDLAFSSDGEYLASAGYDNRVNIWSRQGELTKVLKGASDSVARVSFLGNNQIIATTSWNNQVQLWRLDDTLLKTLSGHSDRITAMDWYKDGEALITASQDGTIILWDLKLENLLQNSCTWLKDYLKNNTQVRESDRQLCQP